MTRPIATRAGKPAYLDAKPRKLTPPVPVVRKGFWAHLVQAWRGRGE